MLASMTGYLRRHHVGVIALFIALGGTSYAAVKLPANSVGSKQIKNNAVRSSEVKNKSLKREDFAAGTLVPGPAGPRGATGARGPVGPSGPSFAPDIFPIGEDIAGATPDERPLQVDCDEGELALGGYTITPPASGSIEVLESREVFDDQNGISGWRVVAREVGVGATDSWTLRVDVNCIDVTQ